MTIDFHTHVFPDKIAEKAIATLSFVSGGLVPSYDGTIKGLKNRMEQEQVDVSVVLNIATNEKQMHNVNDFAAAMNRDNVVAFGSVHPDAPNALEELERIKDLGLKGVKFHPEYQNFYVDDEKMRPIYRKIGELGLITVFHAGGDLGYSAPYHCEPKNALNALAMFSSPVVLAHWGGYMRGEDVCRYLLGTDAYFDTSFGYGTLPRKYALEILEKHGADKLLLGSDGPWHTVSQEKRFLATLGLSNEETEKINHLNAEKLLKL